MNEIYFFIVLSIILIGYSATMYLAFKVKEQLEKKEKTCKRRR